MEPSQRNKDKSRSIKKRWTLFGALIGMGATLALVIGLGVLAGAGAAASSDKPVNTSTPSISGTPQAGEKLTASDGAWTNATSFNYFWTRCSKSGNSCSNISGATSKTYTVTSADVGQTLRFKVEAMNADGSTFLSSDQTAVVIAAGSPLPHNTSLPTISGTPQEGKTLSANRGEWSGNPGDYNYYWLRCDGNGNGCSKISGANNATYILTSSEVGSTLRFRVDAKNGEGTTTAYSVPTAVVAAAPSLPRITSSPTISGTPVVGRVLTLRAGTWSGAPISYRYQWYRCDRNGGGCVVIGGATGLTWRVLSASVGHTIRARVTATNAGGTTGATSVPTAVISAAATKSPPPPTTAAGCPGGNGRSTSPTSVRRRGC